MAIPKGMSREEYNARNREWYATREARRREIDERAKQFAIRMELEKQGKLDYRRAKRYIQVFSQWFARVPAPHERERLAWSLQVVGGSIGVSRRHQLAGEDDWA